MIYMETFLDVLALNLVFPKFQSFVYQPHNFFYLIFLAHVFFLIFFTKLFYLRNKIFQKRSFIATINEKPIIFNYTFKYGTRFSN